HVEGGAKHDLNNQVGSDLVRKDQASVELVWKNQVGVELILNVQAD
ncbi:hypothetical protein A2U01_0054723, partial [Trifolium medium]|nr:hypothetical protein [Trifolium medium]